MTRMNDSNRAVILVSLSVFLASSIWFSGTAAAPALREAWSLNEVRASGLTASVQFGFIAGTLLFALLNIADVFRTRSVFFASALAGAVFNAAFALLARNWETAIVFRFLTGISLAGVYPVGMKIVAQWKRLRLGWGLAVLVGALTLGKSFPYFLASIGSGLGWRTLAVAASALAAAGGIIVRFGVGEGRFLPASARFDVRAAFRVFQRPSFRLQSFGYFGHMWELYAFWSLSASFLAAGPAAREGRFPVPVAFAAFLTIAAGVPGCWTAGWLSRTMGERRVAFISLVASGAFCALSWLLFTLPFWLLMPAFLIWGFFVVADSAQFSALAARTCPPEYTGTALTIQNGIGFTVTAVAIPFTAWMAQALGWRWAFVFLAAGPLFGAVSLVRFQKVERTLFRETNG
jgi:MFS family permease